MCGLPTAKTIQLSAEASVKSSLAKDKTFLFLRKKRKQKNDHRQLDKKLIGYSRFKKVKDQVVFFKKTI